MNFPRLTSVVASWLVLSAAHFAGSAPPQEASLLATERRQPVRIDPDGDPLPEGALLRFGSIRYRHTDGINGSALSPDGKLLATTAKATVAVWDLATGRRVYLFRDCGIPDGFGDGVKVAFSPDGKRLAHICLGDFAARVWDVESGRLLRTVGTQPPAPRAPGGGLPAPATDHDPLAGVRFSTDCGKLLVVASRTITVFDLGTGQEVRKTQVSAAPIAFTPDGAFFCGLQPGQRNDPQRRLLICETATGKEVARYAAPNRENMGLWAAFSPDGKTLATLGDDDAVHLLDASTGKKKSLIRLAKGDSDRARDFKVTLIYFSPDGKTLFTGTQAQGIGRYDIDTGRELPQLRGHRLWVTGLHASLDGKLLVSTSWDATVRRWDLATGKELSGPDGYTARVSVARSPDGRRVAIGDQAGRLDVRDAHDGKILRCLQKTGATIGCVTFSPDGRTLAAGCSDGVARIWEIETGRAIRSLAVPDREAKPDYWSNSITFSPDGRQLVTSMRKDSLRLWDVNSGKSVWRIASEFDRRVAFSPDGSTIVTGGWDNQLSFLDAKTSKVSRAIAVDGEMATDSIAFAPDGKTVATGHHCPAIRLWDAARGQELKQLRGHDDVVWSARFSPDGKWLVSGSCDHTVRIWEVATGQEVRRWGGHDGWVMETEFGPDMRDVLSADGVEVLRWETRPKDVPDADVPALWEKLGSSDAALSFRAVWALVDRASDASAFFRQKLDPVKAPDPNRVQVLIEKLNSDQFATRDTATKTLAAMGRLAEPALREAAGKPRSPESRQRLRLLLDSLSPDLSPEELRDSRAIQVLELAATPEARRVLADWAAGAPGARLTEDAKAALVRLSRAQPK